MQPADHNFDFEITLCENLLLRPKAKSTGNLHTEVQECSGGKAAVED